MKIIEYQPKYKDDFVRLNRAWIEKYFKMEQEDYDVLNNVNELIAKGAMVFFAVENDTVLAAGMSMPLNNGDWEICKLAADENYRGNGAGSAVFKECMEYAVKQGAEKLIIVSNTILKPALHIYKKFGFKEIPMDKTHNYERGDIQLEYIVKEKNKTIVKKEEAKKRIFKGVNLDSLAVGEKSMVTKMNYVKGNFADTHTHPHEQSGYVISGKYEMTVDEQKYILLPGDSYAVPGNVPHSFRVIEGGEVVDVFTPIREDYL